MESLDVMAIFARVVEAEGFTAAARELDLSKSAVSKRIAGLEDRMGVRLLNRTTRRLSLTEAGEAFYQGCRRVVAEANAAREIVGHLAERPRGRLSISGPMSFGVRHLAPILPDFMARYPEVTIDLQLGDRRVDLVEEGFDLALRIGRLGGQSLVARRLAGVRRGLVAAPAYLDAHGRPRTLDDLHDHECLLYTYQESGSAWRFSGSAGSRAVRVQGRLRVNNGDALLSAVVAGMGIALLPRFICAEAVRSGRLEELLPGWRETGDSGIYAVYPARRNLSPKVRVFVDFLSERFGSTPYWDQGLAS